MTKLSDMELHELREAGHRNAADEIERLRKACAGALVVFELKEMPERAGPNVTNGILQREQAVRDVLKPQKQGPER